MKRDRENKRITLTHKSEKVGDMSEKKWESKRSVCMKCQKKKKITEITIKGYTEFVYRLLLYVII